MNINIIAVLIFIVSFSLITDMMKYFFRPLQEKKHFGWVKSNAFKLLLSWAVSLLVCLSFGLFLPVADLLTTSGKVQLIAFTVLGNVGYLVIKRIYRRFEFVAGKIVDIKNFLKKLKK